jgi:hypothetical protein
MSIAISNEVENLLIDQVGRQAERKKTHRKSEKKETG